MGGWAKAIGLWKSFSIFAITNRHASDLYMRSVQWSNEHWAKTNRHTNLPLLCGSPRDMLRAASCQHSNRTRTGRGHHLQSPEITYHAIYTRCIAWICAPRLTVQTRSRSSNEGRSQVYSTCIRDSRAIYAAFMKRNILCMYICTTRSLHTRDNLYGWLGWCI